MVCCKVASPYDPQCLWIKENKAAACIVQLERVKSQLHGAKDLKVDAKIKKQSTDAFKGCQQDLLLPVLLFMLLYVAENM